MTLRHIKAAACGLQLVKPDDATSCVPTDYTKSFATLLMSEINRGGHSLLTEAVIVNRLAKSIYRDAKI